MKKTSETSETPGIGTTVTGSAGETNENNRRPNAIQRVMEKMTTKILIVSLLIFY